MSRGLRSCPAGALAARLGFNTACLPNRTLGEAARLGAGLGLRGIELLAFEGYRHSRGDLAGLFFDHLTAAQRALLEHIVADFEHVSVHAPFWDTLPFSPNPGMRAQSRRQLRATIQVSAALGASTITTHLIPRVGYELGEYRAQVIDFYRELGDLAGEAGVTVTIETGCPQGIEQFAALIHDIDHMAVGANVDVGHLRGLLSPEQRRGADMAALYNDLLAAHIASLGAKVMHLHLHDVRADDLRDHRECGTGIIDYPRMLRMLLEMGYRGLANFELEEPDDVAALGRSRAVLVDALRAATLRESAQC
ncbi:MAG: sugar phosphate isomerase/epimerase family protein [Armatimonadota bacterium]